MQEGPDLIIFNVLDGGKHPVVVAPPFASRHNGLPTPERVPAVSNLTSVPCTAIPVGAPSITGLFNTGVLMTQFVVMHSSPVPLWLLVASAVPPPTLIPAEPKVTW